MLCENASKMPFQLKRKHAKPPKTMPKTKRTVIVNIKCGHLFCFTHDLIPGRRLHLRFLHAGRSTLLAAVDKEKVSTASGTHRPAIRGESYW